MTQRGKQKREQKDVCLLKELFYTDWMTVHWVESDSISDL